ncbi:hypothetical protein [Flavobacterium sp.]|uniref:hypothetical protein n=1 Tax=Flavobacterium sp. TaxID=239 RepID=UPI003D12E0C0
MYYLIKSTGGQKSCIDKNPSNIYTSNMNIDCRRSYSFPSNIVLVKNISIRCLQSTNGSAGQVYCDYVTAKKENIV